MYGLTALIGVAIAGSILWLGGAAAYVDSRIGWENLFSLYPTELATLSAAAFTPVAGLWLVIAFIGNSLGMSQQSKTIRQFLWQARRSAEHTEVIARMMVEMQHQAKHGGFFASLAPAIAELNSQIAGIALRYGLITEGDLPDLWRRASEGDNGCFARKLLDAAILDVDFPEKLGRRAAGDSIMRHQVSTFFRRYGRIVGLARQHDADKLIVDLLEDGDLGLLRNLLAQVSLFRAEASMVNSMSGLSLTAAEAPHAELAPEAPEWAAESAPFVPAEAPEPEPEPQQEVAPEAPPPLPQRVPRREAVGAPLPPASRAQPTASTASTDEPPALGGKSGQPFSPLSPGFPKADGWPTDRKPGE